MPRGARMEFLGLTRAEWIETVVALAIFAGAVVLARLVVSVLRSVVHRLTSATETTLDDALVEAVRVPLIAFLIVQGAAIAAHTVSYLDEYQEGIQRAWLALAILIVVVGIQRVLSALLTWYAMAPAPALRVSRLSPQSLPLVRRAVNILTVLVGVLVVLDTLGLAISPLLAGLGIGGLAVALALQPLLANVFASSYMLSDASIRVGDFVEVHGGPVGVVQDIGWRATRIRSFDNNVVIIPNSRLAESTVTNYDALNQEADARVNIGVAYEEDLDRVEQVCTEEMIALRDELDFAVKDYEPIVRYQTFGDSNVDILLKLRAISWGDSFLLKHLLMKRIHARFRAEGITINYPARRLMLQEGDVPGLAGAFTRAD
jgi:small-conductance mechanosensitive channel